MSHLPLDGRAILAYLNELGYRNISAEQLREFMKGMQSQSNNNNNKRSAATHWPPLEKTTATAAAATTTTTAKPSPKPSSSAKETINSKNHKHHRFPKLVKGEKPLIYFKFYLDICDHQLTKIIEEKITTFGGCLEFFLSSNITHFITDKSIASNNNNNSNHISKISSDLLNRNRLNFDNPASPLTPATPYSPYSQDPSSCESIRNVTNVKQAIRKPSRADAMLNKARKGNTTIHDRINNNNNNSNSNNNNNSIGFTSDQSQPYIIWSTEYALRFFKRISHHVKEYLDSSVKKSNNGESHRNVEPISLKGNFIKIESTRHSQRPYYQLFRRPSEWPKIELSRDDGAFRLSPKRELDHLEEIKMTRKSRSRPSQCHATNATAKEKPKQSLRKSDAESGAIRTFNTKAPANALHLRSDAGACKHIKESSQKQCGVCEICKIEYDTLTIHLQTKDHEYFAKNSQNFIALDTLIHATSDVNKFLDANQSIGMKTEIEDEMEVAEETTGLEVDVPDPLENHESLPSLNKVQTKKKRSSGNSQNTPSPNLREKSKRSTKGKHSSEKFQNFSPGKSTRSPTKSPQKKSSQTTTNNLLPDLQKHNNEPIPSISLLPPVVTPPRKKPKPSLMSSPIRAMLPPSSLYKVVETKTERPKGSNTSPNKMRDTTASPSLIVKFKKVRQAELLRLNGEAENFMFPRCRTSSELPTDIDRSTTSDNLLRGTSISSSISTSLDSSSENHVMNCVTNFSDEDSRDPFRRTKLNEGNTTIEQRKFVVAKRRKGRPCGPRNFRSAPIQPDEFTIKPLPNELLMPETTTTNIMLPEATRKSSRTATAIVTAATKSSRMLRAAVEAARNNKRLLSLNDCIETKCPKKTLRKVMSEGDKVSISNKSLSRKRISTIVKLEDRMGDIDEEAEQDTDETDNDEDENKVDYDDDDNDIDDSDDIEEEEEDDDDDDNDEDYINSYVAKTKLPTIEIKRKKRKCTIRSRGKVVNNNNNNKIKKPRIKKEIDSDDDDDFEVSKKRKTTSSVRKKSVKTPKTSPIKKTTTIRRPAFDISKCERLQELRYSFERVPVFDAWYKVFSRQDAGEETIPEYYGSTNYRKLPYELGPIPFNKTLDGICCKLCEIGVSQPSNKSLDCVDNDNNDDAIKHKTKENSEEISSKINVKTEASDLPSAGTLSSALEPPVENASLKYTHKKLHLLQRYRREQQELLQKQQEEEQKLQNNNVGSDKPRLNNLAYISNDDQRISLSKSSSPEREAHAHRASSTHSNASSCTSSSGTITTFSKKFTRSKHLNKASFLSLEHPPRKSPREHPSTLAFVSCLIKQRQDSQSKPNSEIDEPPPLTSPINFVNDDKQHPSFLNKTETICRTIESLSEPIALQTVTNEIAETIVKARSSPVTPVEEMRFTTEISENVKRLRRGQNKYDYSHIVSSSPFTSESKNKNNDICINHDFDRGNNNNNAITLFSMTQRKKDVSKYESFSESTNVTAKQQNTPLIRKTGYKKGVLEFEMDEAALEALESSRKYTNVRKLAREIDQYLEVSGRDYDFVEPIINKADKCDSSKNTSLDTNKDSTCIDPIIGLVQTPPPTDYFSSSFDLCDLFKNQKNDQRNCKKKPLEGWSNHKNLRHSFQGSEILHGYFKKRKSLKSNRTGWPKTQKKKNVASQQQLKPSKNTDQFNSLQNHSAEFNVVESHEEVVEGGKYEEGEKEGRKGKEREDVVITPPDTDDLDEDEDDENEETKTANDMAEADEIDDTEVDAGESIRDCDADRIAEDWADIEMENYNKRLEEKEDEEDCIRRNNKMFSFENNYEKKCYQSKTRYGRRCTPASPTLAKLSTPVNDGAAEALSTSTPSKHMQSAPRSTPQLNGSLGSCVSPSEKADNSDIFTVSSDGLDTDMDQSNSHTAPLKANEEQCQEHNVTLTPKRKFDLAKCARSNNAATVSATSSTSCAVEAVTVAAAAAKNASDLRKLIKYEERLQTNINKDDFFEGLFQRTTASFRAKRDKENGLKVTTRKTQEKFSTADVEQETKRGRKKITAMSNENIPPSTKGSATTFKIYSSGTSLTHRDSRQVLKEKYQHENLDENLVNKKRSERDKASSLIPGKCNCGLLAKSDEAQSASSTTNATGISRKLVEDSKEPNWQCFCRSSSRSRSQTTGRNTVTTTSNSCSTTNAPPIRPRSRSNQRHPIGVSATQSASVLIPKPRPKCHNNNRFSDPVKLYQYYQREWKHFRNQIPGELTRADVRWQIRQKLLDPN